MRRRAVREEELAAVGVFAFVRHGQHAAAVELAAQGALELVVEIPVPDAGAALARARRVAALDHEVGDVAVEEEVVVVGFLGELDEIPAGFGGEFRVQFEGYLVRCWGGRGEGVEGQEAVALCADAAGDEEIGFKGEGGEIRGCMGGEAGRRKGGGGEAGSVQGARLVRCGGICGGSGFIWIGFRGRLA